jgi:hypothetical protein
MFKQYLRSYRRSINPPYSRRDIVSVLATLFILIALPLTVFVSLNARSFRPKAADISPPTGGSIIYTGGNITVASVALTVNDGTDSGSGINTNSRIIQRKSATLTSGKCGTYGTWTTIKPAGTYPKFTDNYNVLSGNCYQYQYLVSDNSGNQATYSPLDMGIVIHSTSKPYDGTWSVFNGYVDDLIANGITNLRVDIPDYQDVAWSKANVPKAIVKGAKVTWGVSSNRFNNPAYMITAANWPAYRQGILDAAAWAQLNGVYEFQLGNEEEYHVDGTTMLAAHNPATPSVPDIITNLKSVATDIKQNSIYTRGNISYSCFHENINDWISVGKGDIDILASNVYMAWGVNNNPQPWKSEIDNLVKAFGTGGTYITEFGPNSSGLKYWSPDQVENEAADAAAVKTELDYIKSVGITRADYYEYIDDDFGARKISDGNYRQLWNTLKSNVNTVIVTLPPTGGSIIYTGGNITGASVALTVSDGTDNSGSGINTNSRIIQRKSATLSNGTCGSYGAWTTISTTGSYPNFTDTVSSGNCYQYQYLVSDNLGHQATYSSFDLGMGEFSSYPSFDSYVDDLLANGFTNLRIDIPDYQNTNWLAQSKTAVIRALTNHPALKITWGVSQNNGNPNIPAITTANWPNFRAAILDAAAWAQANGVYEFQIGNEEELHNNDGDLSDDVLQKNLKEVAKYIKEHSIYNRGNISYTTTGDYFMGMLHTLGRGDIDILAFNMYFNQYDPNPSGTNLYVNLAHDLAGLQATLANMMSWWGVDHTYITEFSVNYNFLDYYSTDEAVQAAGLASMINAIKAAGVTRADFFFYGPDTYRFGAMKDDGTYRQLWNTLKSNVNTVKVTVSGTCTKVGDLNCDQYVNIYDLSTLLTRWGTNDATADLNKNGLVDILDLPILISHWGT